jgi:hypothetical protein
VVLTWVVVGAPVVVGAIVVEANVVVGAIEVVGTFVVVTTIEVVGICVVVLFKRMLSKRLSNRHPLASQIIRGSILTRNNYFGKKKD